MPKGKTHESERERVSVGATTTADRDSHGETRLLEISHALLDQLSEGMVIVDGDGAVQSINRAAREILALGETEVVGKPGVEIVRSAVPGEDLLESALRGEPSDGETLLTTPAGAEVPARIAVLPRERGGAVVVIGDLTTRRRLEAALRRRERLALMGQLVAGVAHEVRNPLAGISSSAQVLLGRFEPRDERTRFVKAILDEVGRLDRIVTRLLQFARPGEPRLQLDSLPSVVDRVVENSQEWLTERGVEIERDEAESIPDVWFDPDLIYQVVLNLVHNAVQAMPDGGTIRIEIRPIEKRLPIGGGGRRKEDAEPERTTRRATTRTVVQVRVIDGGHGIAKEMIPQLFDPFFTTKASGTGLGLSICQSILQEHGGTIQLASREGSGTTVVFEIPVDKRQGERRTQ